MSLLTGASAPEAGSHNMGSITGDNAKLLGRLPADGNIRVPPLDVAIQRERPENHLHFCVILHPLASSTISKSTDGIILSWQ